MLPKRKTSTRSTAAAQTRHLPQLSVAALRSLMRDHTPSYYFVPASISDTGRREWVCDCQCRHSITGSHSMTEAIEAHDGHLARIIHGARERAAEAQLYYQRQAAL